MSYSLKIIKEKKLILIKYDELSTFEDRLKVLDEVIEYLKKAPKLNIFIDDSTVNKSLTEDEQEELGMLLGMNSLYFQYNKTVVLKDKLLNPLILPVAYINGYSNLVEFDNKNEALQWLSGEI